VIEDIVPAYACTIHTSQGGEYPAVVIVLHHQHHVMLQRNLLDASISRGRRLVVIVGSKRALYRAVHNATARNRSTMLAERCKPSPSPLSEISAGARSLPDTERERGGCGMIRRTEGESQCRTSNFDT
jgi:superfamily I DNA and RNA helicase